MRIKDTTKAYTNDTLQLPSKEEGGELIVMFKYLHSVKCHHNLSTDKILFKNQEKLNFVNQLVNQFKGCKCVEI